MPQNISADERTVKFLKEQIQQDEKKDDFPFICLTRRERKLLRSAQSSLDGWAKADGKNHAAAQRLAALNLVRLFRNDSPGKENCYLCEIRLRGKNYLLYLKSNQRQKHTETIRYVITTVIAVLALVLAGVSLAAQLGLISLPEA